MKSQVVCCWSIPRIKKNQYFKRSNDLKLSPATHPHSPAMSRNREIVVAKRSRQIIDQRLQSLIHGLLFDRENVERKLTDILIQHLAPLPLPVPIQVAPRKTSRDPSSDDVPIGDDLPKRPRTITREISLPQAPSTPLPVPSAPPLSIPLEDWTVHQVNSWTYKPTADFEFKFDPSFGLSQLSLNDSVSQDTSSQDELDEKHTEENEAAQCYVPYDLPSYDPDDPPSYEEYVVARRPDILAQCTLGELEYYYSEAAKDRLARKSRMIPKQKTGSSPVA